MIIQNFDVKKFVNRLRRFGEELFLSGSANVSGFVAPDLRRANINQAELVNVLDSIQALPELDMPESSPKDYDMGDLTFYKEVENEYINDILDLYVRLEEELLLSQSSRISNRFMSFDEERIRIFLERNAQLLSGVTASTSALDLPESSPRTPVTPRGRGKSPSNK